MATPAELANQAQAAADLAREAATAAATYADAIADNAAAAASVATGGFVDPFVFRLAIFVLAIFVGYFVVWSVTPALHTPLMSVTNAISSVIVVGAILAVGVEVVPLIEGQADGHGWARIFGGIALVLAAINIFGGFLVTQRMLAMYKAKAPAAGAKKGH
ncbi:MAG: NAD(P) transhydrogenase subunit alpha [Bauldia sp.]|nr:NAD(P) transhydrogenase subunit alpha [Bauldia sp.]